MITFGGEAERRIEEFSQQNLANLTWAFGKLSHCAPSLLDAVGQKATAVVEVHSFTVTIQCHLLNAAKKELSNLTQSLL